jgi:hypothetical protein
MYGWMGNLLWLGLSQRPKIPSTLKYIVISVECQELLIRKGDRSGGGKERRFSAKFYCQKGYNLWYNSVNLWAII